MNFDQPPAPESGEKIEKQAVIDAIKANGLDNPETILLLNKWTDQRKVEIDGSENPGSGESALNIEISDMYLEAGKIDAAFVTLEDALNQADQEGNVELQDQIVAKLKAIRAQNNELVKKLATHTLLPDSEVSPSGVPPKE